MKLYYTTAEGAETPQTLPSRSLGGYKSSSPVLNDSFENLFGELSLYSVSNTKIEYRALILVNEFHKPSDNIELWFDRSNSKKPYCNFLIGAVKLNTDKEGNFFMENVPSVFSKPLYTELYPATEDAKVTIGSLQPREAIGLWIARVPDKEAIEKDYNDIAVKTTNPNGYGVRYKKVEKEKEESINFEISWN